jgi:hypothetical protein
LEAAMTTDTNPQQPRSKALLAWMIVSQIVSIIPILLGAGFTVLGFLMDGKISIYTFAYYLSPALTLIPLVASWVAYSRRNEKAAWILTSIPPLYICGDMIFLFGGIFL